MEDSVGVTFPHSVFDIYVRGTFILTANSR
jgi:hypothetical protein